MDTHLNPRSVFVLGVAGAAICGNAAAEVAAATAEPTSPPQRETTVGLGFAAIAPFKAPVGYDAAHVPLSSATFAGYSLEVTRRFRPQLEGGIVIWLAPSSSDGKGSYAHALSRFAGELRFVPWGFGRVEPWIGGELGIVLADDYASWDATAMTGPHAVSATRLGHFEEITAGARLRLSTGIALEARGGVSLVGFAKPSVEHETGDTTGAYLVRPTDYRTRIWYSAMLSLEITVMD